MLPPAVRSGARILLVSDDPTVGDACARALRLEGHEVWAALSPDDGLRLARAHSPGAVIVDFRTPLSRGAHFVRALRRIEGLATVPVAVVSGDHYPSAEARDELTRLDVHLRYKPVWLRELVDLARSLVRPAASAAAGS